MGNRPVQPLLQLRTYSYCTHCHGRIQLAGSRTKAIPFGRCSSTQSKSNPTQERPQYDTRELRYMGRPLCDVAIFQTSAIATILATRIKGHNDELGRTSPCSCTSPAMSLDAPQIPVTPWSNTRKRGRDEKLILESKQSCRKSDVQCMSCRTSQTPKWRSGPLGSQTLCNVCGLIYAKRQNRSHPGLLNKVNDWDESVVQEHEARA